MTVLYCTVLYCTVPGISCPVYVGGDGCTLMVAISIVFVVIVGVILTVLWQARLHKIPIWSSNCPVSVSPTLVTRWLPRINTLYLRYFFASFDSKRHYWHVHMQIDFNLLLIRDISWLSCLIFADLLCKKSKWCTSCPTLLHSELSSGH